MKTILKTLLVLLILFSFSNSNAQKNTLKDENLLLEIPLNGTLAIESESIYPVSTYGNVNFVTDDTSVFKNSLHTEQYGGLIIKNMGTTYEQITYMMWVKTTSERVGFFSFGKGQPTPVFDWCYYNNTMSIAKRVFYGNYKIKDIYQIIMDARLVQPINDGHWHHVAISSDLSNKELNLYVDGKLISSVTFTSTINNNLLPELYLGHSACITGNGVKELAYFRVYSKNLSAKQIQGIMLLDQGIIPKIDLLSPTKLSYGDPLKIEGSNFSSVNSDNTIHFAGGATVIPSIATENTLTVAIPKGALNGAISVTSNSISSDPSINTLTISPSILSFSPTIGRLGETIVIKGINFSSTIDNNIVHFTGDAMAVPTEATNTSLTVTIPQKALSGPVWVTSNTMSSLKSTTNLSIIKLVTSIITFNNLSPNSSSSYSEEGFTIIAEKNDKGLCTGTCMYGVSGNTNITKSKGAFLKDANSKLVLKSNSEFTLKSLYLKNNYLGNKYEVVFIGTRSDGGIVTYKVTPVSNSDIYQKFIFPEDFTELTSVSWNPNTTVVSDIKVDKFSLD